MRLRRSGPEIARPPSHLPSFPRYACDLRLASKGDGSHVSRARVETRIVAERLDAAPDSEADRLRLQRGNEGLERAGRGDEQLCDAAVIGV